jgi:hypothetical protein
MSVVISTVTEYNDPTISRRVQATSFDSVKAAMLALVQFEKEAISNKNELRKYSSTCVEVFTGDECITKEIHVFGR